METNNSQCNPKTFYGYCSPAQNSFTAGDYIPVHDGSGNCTIPKMMRRCPNVCSVTTCDCPIGECKVMISYLKPQKEDMQLTTLAGIKAEIMKTIAYCKSQFEKNPEMRLIVVGLENELERIDRWMHHEANMIKKAFIDGQIDANKQQFAIGIPKMADDYFNAHFTQNNQTNETI